MLVKTLRVKQQITQFMICSIRHFFTKQKHYVQLYPRLSRTVVQCQVIPPVKGGKHLKSSEEMTLRDPEAMAIYALGIAPLLRWLWRLSKVIREHFPARQVTFADDLNGVGPLGNLRK